MESFGFMEPVLCQVCVEPAGVSGLPSGLSVCLRLPSLQSALEGFANWCWQHLSEGAPVQDFEVSAGVPGLLGASNAFLLAGRIQTASQTRGGGRGHRVQAD